MKEMLVIKKGEGRVEITTGIKTMEDFHWLLTTLELVKEDLLKSYRESCPFRFNVDKVK